jgi:hypothetical protein
MVQGTIYEVAGTNMNKLEAFELALRLAIVAPDQTRAAQVVAMAEEMAAGLTSEEVSTVMEAIEYDN